MVGENEGEEEMEFAGQAQRATDNSDAVAASLRKVPSARCHFLSHADQYKAESCQISFMYADGTSPSRPVWRFLHVHQSSLVLATITTTSFSLTGRSPASLDVKA